MTARQYLIGFGSIVTCLFRFHVLSFFFPLFFQCLDDLPVGFFDECVRHLALSETDCGKGVLENQTSCLETTYL